VVTIIVTYFTDIGESDNDLIVKIIIALLVFAICISSSKVFNKILDIIKLKLSR
jgi:hypothetical protein